MNIDNLNIKLDPSVKHLTKVACMALSGYISGGLLLTNNPAAKIIIYKDRIDFGQCLHSELQGYTGKLSPLLPVSPNFYKEYANIVYHYGANLKCSIWTKTLDYVGMFAPTTPDNYDIYKQLYPRYQ